MLYCPVAVTPQVKLKLIVALAGKVLSSRPAGKSRFGHNAGNGQAAAIGKLLGVQAVTVQLSPALGISLAKAPFAAVVPLLVKVTV